jgi:hypothetical protein
VIFVELFEEDKKKRSVAPLKIHANIQTDPITVNVSAVEVKTCSINIDFRLTVRVSGCTTNRRRFKAVAVCARLTA